MCSTLGLFVRTTLNSHISEGRRNSLELTLTFKIVDTRSSIVLCNWKWAYTLAYGVEDLGESTHTLVTCWIPKPLPPRNQCTGCFAPAWSGACQVPFHLRRHWNLCRHWHFLIGCIHEIRELIPKLPLILDL